jgi:DNA polymerase (family X)
VLAEIASLLEAQDASVFRVRAYMRAADTVHGWPDPVADLFVEGGVAALERLPGIGKGLAATIGELLRTGRSRLLERLQGEIAPEQLLGTVPGLGEKLAHRIFEQLGIESLEELEMAAYDGRLARVRGFGPRRLRAVREVLAGRLGRSARRSDAYRFPPDARPFPAVATILEVDALYRRQARAGSLRTIAPRRFNPTGAAWLPVLHTERDGWLFHVLFSNTALAHRLGKTRDWVVMYVERDGEERQVTVVTEQHGPLKGRRVIRGRESECLQLYRRKRPAPGGVVSTTGKPAPGAGAEEATCTHANSG